jgi:hypothetical protein
MTEGKVNWWLTVMRRRMSVNVISDVETMRTIMTRDNEVVTIEGCKQPCEIVGVALAAWYLWSGLI